MFKKIKRVEGKNKFFLNPSSNS